MPKRKKFSDFGQGQVRVLLVDDEHDFLLSLMKILRAKGLIVKTATSGAEAFVQIEKESFDVVVLDLRMPGLDGIQTLEGIKKKSPQTEVVILTGHGTVQAGLQAMKEMAFDFLLKPVPVEKLLKVIQAACTRRLAGKS